MNRCGTHRRERAATGGTALYAGRRASVRAGRLCVMTAVISDPRMLSVLDLVARGVDPARIGAEAGLTPEELAAALARLAACGLVRRQRRGARVSWGLGANVANWLAAGYEIAASLRRE